MLRTVTLSALLCVLTALAGCNSNKAEESTYEFPCICGTPEAAVTDCMHPVCVAGVNNPENHDCVCGDLSLEQ